MFSIFYPLYWFFNNLFLKIFYKEIHNSLYFFLIFSVLCLNLLISFLYFFLLLLVILYIISFCQFFGFFNLLFVRFCGLCLCMCVCLSLFQIVHISLGFVLDFNMCSTQNHTYMLIAWQINKLNNFYMSELKKIKNKF